MRRDDVFEGRNCLRNAVLEHLEVGGLKPIDDAAVAGRVRIDANEVGTDPNRLLTGWHLRLVLCGKQWRWANGSQERRHKYTKGKE